MRLILIILLLLTSRLFAQISTDLPLGPIGNNNFVTTMSENRDFIRVKATEATTITQLTTITLTTVSIPTILLLDDGTTLSTTTIHVIPIRARLPGKFFRRPMTERNYHFNPFTGGFYRPMSRQERLARGIP